MSRPECRNLLDNLTDGTLRRALQPDRRTEVTEAPRTKPAQDGRPGSSDSDAPNFAANEDNVNSPRNRYHESPPPVKRKATEPPFDGPPKSPKSAAAKPIASGKPTLLKPKAPVRAAARDPDFNRNTAAAPPAQRKLYDPREAQQSTPGKAILGQQQSRQPERPNQQNVALSSQPSSPVKQEFEPILDPSHPDHPGADEPAPDESEASLRMIKEPIMQPISPEQLIAEVKGIYAGLIMVEAKCVDVDNRQHQAALDADGNQKALDNRQWQALIALHRTLLHEHHDFFLASQHPAASPALKKLAQKYAMPARMWRHGIHSFLELLRHRLPESLEHMLTFIYISYSMMTLLYETVPAFKDTWIECLGDLARYRMAIEEEDPRDREIWQGVARTWYALAADRTPEIGRLYHHLAILARPNILCQLFFYCKSLSVPHIFSAARESILTVFDPMFNPDVALHNTPSFDIVFVQLHSITFTHIDLHHFERKLRDLLNLLEKHLSKLKSADPETSQQAQVRWNVQASWMAVCNAASLFQYGMKKSVLRREVSGTPQAASPGDNDDEAEGSAEVKGEPNAADFKSAPDQPNLSISQISLGYAKRMSFEVLKQILQFDSGTHLYAWMMFLSHMADHTSAMRLLEDDCPWESIAMALNRAVEVTPTEEPQQAIEGRPLPEDFLFRGLDWSQKYYPENYFENNRVDAEERSFELVGMADIRRRRIVKLGMEYARKGDWIAFDDATKKFTVAEGIRDRVFAAAQARKEAEKPKPVFKQEDEDVEMAAGTDAGDEDYMLVNLSEPMRKLKEQKRQLEAQIRNPPPTNPSENSPRRSPPPKPAPAFLGVESIAAGYTAFFVDTNLLVSHLATFHLLIRDGWSVVVPNVVLIELQGLKNNTAELGKLARSAEDAIKKAIEDNKDIKIITAKGIDVTKRGFFKEKIQREEGEQNIDDVIVRITKSLSEERLKTKGANGKASPAILVTEDSNLRVKANARGVPSISTVLLKRCLSSLWVAATRTPSTKGATATMVEPRIMGGTEDVEMRDVGTS